MLDKACYNPQCDQAISDVTILCLILAIRSLINIAKDDFSVALRLRMVYDWGCVVSFYHGDELDLKTSVFR
jgi:hypothetical protein